MLKFNLLIPEFDYCLHISVCMLRKLPVCGWNVLNGNPVTYY